MKRSTSIVCKAFVAVSISTSCIAASQQSLQVHATDGLVSVQASNVTAQTLAEELSNQLDITVVLTGDAQARLSVNIEEEPLAKAVAKLSPNNLVVRENSDPNSEIIEVVLMMGENSGDVAGTEQFLPTGSSGEAIVSGDFTDQNAAVDSNNQDYLRDPDRAVLVRQAADIAAYDSSVPPDQVPPMYAQDLGDPPSSLPLDQQQ